MNKSICAGTTFLSRSVLITTILLWLLGASVTAHAQDLAQQGGRIQNRLQRAEQKQPAGNLLLSEALDELSRKYQVFVTYNSERLKEYTVGTEYRQAGNLDAGLETLLRGTGFGFNKRGEKNFVIVEKRPRPAPTRGLTSASGPTSVTSPRPGIRVPVKNITGRVTEAGSDDGLPGVTITVVDSNNGTVTDVDGAYQLTVEDDASTLVFSYVGYRRKEIAIGDRTVIDVEMEGSVEALSEVVVVGYGTQKKSDITGAVASVPEDRLEMVPNLSVAQAIQGAIPGVMVNTGSAGASPNGNSIMIRGRNSIRAGNGPLIVLDGFPYSGELSDINPNDIQSVEVLKDASSAAIYGSRGANGVILVTTKAGSEGKPTISYDAFYSIQELTNFPDILTGEEFYDFKRTRDSSTITLTERRIYEERSYSDWTDLALRNGRSQQHNLSISGGSQNTKYYIAASYLDVEGIAVNDKFSRITNRFNIDTDIAEWLSIGTRTTFSYDDESGISPNFSQLTYINPLTQAYEEDGSLAIYPDKEYPNASNPLQGLLASDIDKSYQLVSNNFVRVGLPFIPGLEFTLNGGVRYKFSEDATYYGRNTTDGLESRGRSSTSRGKFFSATVENILNYRREFGRHSLFATGLYSYQKYQTSSEGLMASGFPTDILEWYSAAQAELITPSYGFEETNLISQMLRLNYSFDNRYLFTVTGRRDGYSGFGAQDKWGVFPSLAVGWNISREGFYPQDSPLNTLKVRVSWGRNGNQAVGAYETISRFSSRDWVSGSLTQPGYIPTSLGLDNLGWESTASLNIGLDYGLWQDRIYGDINYFRSSTTDLLLNRSISSVHGFGSVTQNIGETENTGLEFSITSRNVTGADFQWTTNANFSTVRNRIVSLYGLTDEDGNEIDDVDNEWFIGQPIRVNYDHRVIGVWQLDEADEAEAYGVEPGFVKLDDIDNDGDIDSDDEVIIGQNDPKFLWGLTNSFEYKNFLLRVFVHGVHGVTRNNTLLSDNVFSDIVRNTTKKNWWTPENPTNEFYANVDGAGAMGSGNATYYEDASFVRFKDITLAYSLPAATVGKIGLNRLRLYLTGRNLFTITKFGGLDPELGGQRSIPLQKEYVFGLNLTL